MKERITEYCELPADASTAYALLTDEEEIRQSYEGRDNVDIEVSRSGQGHIVLVTRPINAGPIELTLKLRQSWRIDNGAESYIADIDYQLGRTVQISGEMFLKPREAGSTLSASLKTNVAIPVLGHAIAIPLAKIVAAKLRADFEYQREILANGYPSSR